MRVPQVHIFITRRASLLLCVKGYPTFKPYCPLGLYQTSGAHFTEGNANPYNRELSATGCNGRFLDAEENTPSPIVPIGLLPDICKHLTSVGIGQIKQWSSYFPLETTAVFLSKTSVSFPSRRKRGPRATASPERFRHDDTYPTAIISEFRCFHISCAKLWERSPYEKRAGNIGDAPGSAPSQRGRRRRWRGASASAVFPAVPSSPGHRDRHHVHQ